MRYNKNFTILSTRKCISKNKNIVAIVAFFCFIGSVSQPAIAFDATAPIEASDGSISCPTCVKSSAAITTNRIPYGTDDTQSLSALSPNFGIS